MSKDVKRRRISVHRRCTPTEGTFNNPADVCRSTKGANRRYCTTNPISTTCQFRNTHSLYRPSMYHPLRLW